MKRLFWVLLGGALLLGGISLYTGWIWWTRPWSGSPIAGQEVLLEIPSGMTLGAAADSLVATGLLRNRDILLLGARLTGQERGLQAGLYRLEGGLSPRQLLTDLTSGQTVQVRMTVAEGLTAEETARIAGGKFDFSDQEFLAVADSLARARILAQNYLGPQANAAQLDSLFSPEHLEQRRRLHWCEGYLAPDTYLFSAGSTAELVAGHLLDIQSARLDSAWALVRAKGQPLSSPQQLLTLASIVEAEARLPQERPLIAAVYSNRLLKKWRLEADPTVAYILRKRGKRMFFKDLEVQSPYNAYRRRGLPPGAIGNPGWACLVAAARPDSTCRAMYFVSDGHGGHVFSRTAREHEQAVRRFRQARAQDRRRQRK